MDENTTQAESLSTQEPKVNKGKPISSVKTAVIIAVIIVLSSLAYAYKGLLIAATVDGRPISRLRVIQKLEKASGKSLLDSLVTENLIQNEAEAKKIVVSDDEVNAVIKDIEGQIAKQGGTLEAALTAQGMTVADLKKQIVIQKEVEKLVADKIIVTDEEVAKYIKDNSVPVPAGQEATVAAQVKDELRTKKLTTESTTLIAALKSKAKILYFVNY